MHLAASYDEKKKKYQKMQLDAFHLRMHLDGFLFLNDLKLLQKVAKFEGTFECIQPGLINRICT